MSLGPFTVIYTFWFTYTPADGGPVQEGLSVTGWAHKGTPFLDTDQGEIAKLAIEWLTDREMPGWEVSEITAVDLLWTDMHPVYDKKLIKKLEELDQ